MPKARLTIELDSPKDYFDILKSSEWFGDSKITMKVDGSKLDIVVKASSAKATVTVLGNLLKQVRIIEETYGAVGRK